MCRLYGFRASEPTKVECTLVYAQNALLRQSRLDSRGASNSDGWGIGYYENGSPRTVRRTTPAFSDVHFSTAAERVLAQTVVAHVRQATVGDNELANTHPFCRSPWIFAHNGTVRGIEDLRPRLTTEVQRHLADRPVGTTDSELTFYWLLSRFVEAGIDVDEPARDLQRLVDTLREAVLVLDGMCRAAGASQPARLNFLLTDGRNLVVSRWGNSLHWVAREGVHDCEVCGVPHVEHDPRIPYRAVVVASEPITHEAWREVPEGSVLAVDSEILVDIHPI